MPRKRKDEESVYTSPDFLGELMDTPQFERILDRAADLFETLTDKLSAAVPGPNTTPKQRPVNPVKNRETFSPIQVMGFPQGMRLTRKIVKDRQRALASLFHPDHGGSEESMTRVNQAADCLLKNLK